jgi:hypothetical protein
MFGILLRISVVILARSAEPDLKSNRALLIPKFHNIQRPWLFSRLVSEWSCWPTGWLLLLLPASYKFLA